MRMFRISVLIASLALALAANAAPGSLDKILPGTKLQPTKALDKKGLKLVLNENASGVVIEGWNTKSMTVQESDALFAKFGIAVDPNGNPQNGSLVAPDNVGRAGIADGTVFMKLDGKIYKGMTLKGYGGNTVHGKDAQPNGSMDIKEAFRDMEVSTILHEGKVSTYLGVLAVERPTIYERAALPAANYVRLSRTALRMEDFIRIKGKDLEELVNYMTDLLQDEVGKKMTVGEFDEWLVKQTADVVARKTHIRFKHGSVTNSNIGIGEMVDLGDETGGLKLPGEDINDRYGNFKDIVKKAHNNLATINAQAQSLNFDKIYDETFNERLQALKQADAARLTLNTATEADLVKIGFTQTEAELVVKLNASTPDGIIDPQEIKSIQAIARDIEEILERTTTNFMKLADGTRLGRYYVRNVGGADGVRALLEETRTFMQQNNLTASRDMATGKVNADAKLFQEIEKLALDRAKKLGFIRVGDANEVTSFSKFIATQILEVIARR